MNAPDFDILVVGGGMVGTCVAALLANQPALAEARIALLEPAVPTLPPTDDVIDIRVSAISRAAERVLAQAGAWQHIPAQHRSAYEAMTVWDADTKADASSALHFSAAETGEPNLGYIIENRRVQWGLFESQALRQRVTVFAAAVADLELRDDLATVVLADQRKLRARLVVAADGAQSRCRELADIPTAGWKYPQSALVTHVRTTKSHQHTAWQRFTPTGPVAFLPLADGRSSIVWTNSIDEADRLLGIDPKEFARELAMASDHVLGDVELTAPRARFPLQLRSVRDYFKSRFVLVGDAAHAIHPLAGQGVNLGMMDAACLVEVLATARAAGASWDTLAEARVLGRYARWRKSENLLALGLVDGINKLFSNDSALLGSVRRAGFAFVERAPPIKRFFIERALGLAGELPGMVR